MAPDCPGCGHRLYLHKRHASGAYRCASFGCGCERVHNEVIETPAPAPTPPPQRLELRVQPMKRSYPKRHC